MKTLPITPVRRLIMAFKGSWILMATPAIKPPKMAVSLFCIADSFFLQSYPKIVEFRSYSPAFSADEERKGN
jgi:hypothetical protein